MKQTVKNPVSEQDIPGKISVHEAMRRAGIGEYLFWKLVEEGKIRIRQLSPKKRFVFIDELEEDMRNMPCLK